MKKLINLIVTLVIIFLFINCGANDPAADESNTLGGETNIAISEVGNTGYVVVELGDNYNRLEGIEITENSNGIVNIHINTDYSNTEGLSEEIEKFVGFNSEFQSNNNKLVGDIKVKLTSEGIQDFNNSDKRAFTLVKYDCKVGDSYVLKLSNGHKIVRKVTAKSTKDDFQWGMMYIKAITVEQNSNIPGIKKYIFKANHKFGLVYVQTVMEDGSKQGMYIYPRNY